MKPLRGNDGQAMAEFALVIPLLVAVIWVCARCIESEWDRSICGYRAFQLAHERLLREDVLERVAPKVDVELQCGEARESVSLLKLEHVRW